MASANLAANTVLDERSVKQVKQKHTQLINKNYAKFREWHDDFSVNARQDRIAATSNGQNYFLHNSVDFCLGEACTKFRDRVIFEF